MDFYSLDPQTIFNAAESVGFECSGHLQQLNSLENRVFDLKLEDGNHLVAKFYRPERWSRDAILDEHRFLFHLADQEIPVCAPISRDGESLFEMQGMHFALWPRTGGRLIDEFSDSILSRIGGYLGRIHLAAKDLALNHRPQMDREYMVERHRRYIEEECLLPPAQARRYADMSEYLGKSADNLYAATRYQMIHGDCHTGNMLLGSNGLFFLDFDDSMSGPVLQDMWMVVSDSPDEQERKTSAFLSGYQRFADFPMESIRFRELLRALRYIAYNGWIARRRDDPAIQRSFPGFGSSEYWEEFLNDLEEQIERIEKDSGYQGGGITPPSPVEETKESLSDEEYFFDLDDGRWSPGQD